MYRCTTSSLCTYATNKKHRLKRHEWLVHNINHSGKYKLYCCSKKDCTFTTKQSHHIKKHLWEKHGEKTDVKQQLYKCTECNYITKRQSDLKRHRNIRHATATTATTTPGGNKYCFICCQECHTLSNYYDSIIYSYINICPKCKFKYTGTQHRLQKQTDMINYLRSKSCIGYYISQIDAVFKNNKCATKRRPDVHICSTNKLHIFVECDEYQHIRGTYSAESETQRMSEIFNEIDDHVHAIFIRFNPDFSRHNRTPLNDRLNTLTQTIKNITTNYQNMQKRYVVYMYYDKTNPLITKKWKHKCIT